MKPLLEKAEVVEGYTEVNPIVMDSNGNALPPEWDANKVMRFFSQTGIMIQDPARRVKIINIDKDGEETIID